MTEPLFSAARLAMIDTKIAPGRNGVIPAGGRKIIRDLCASQKELVEALRKAVSAASYAVRLAEDTLACGNSPNPAVKADWAGTVAHMYAAMNFVTEARAALRNAGVEL